MDADGQSALEATQDAGASPIRRSVGEAYLIILILPILLALASLEWLAWRTGATLSPVRLAMEQTADPSVITLPPALQLYGALKVARVREVQPDIVALGSSRCNEMRSAMFSPYKFYNVCVTSWTVDQQADTLEKVLEVSKPSVVIFTLDYFVFTKQWADNYGKTRNMQYSYGVRGHVNGLSSVLKAILEHWSQLKTSVPELLSPNNRESAENFRTLGIDAIRTGAGIRFDGSFLYPAGQIATVDQTNSEVGKGLIDAMPGAQEMDLMQTAGLKRLSAIAKKRGIKLVGIQLPYLASAVDYLDNNEAYKPYSGVWRDFERPETKALFASLGITYFNLSRDESGKDNRLFLDAAHPGEQAILGALVRQLDNPEFVSIFPRLDAAQMRRTYGDAQARSEAFRIYRQDFSSINKKGAAH